jgi:MoxR-like ATPase
MSETIDLNGVPVTLSYPDTHEFRWVDYNDYLRQLEAAWLRLSDDDLPLNPRIVGGPGVGKTTLACAAARATGREVYMFQCTTDTRPEDLVITPVLTGAKQIEYRASAVVTAMIRGGAAVLDEGNRMPERSWASLAPLMDDRRYIESDVTALKIQAHPNFRLAVTMNADASVYELPGYIQSRLKPKIEIVEPPWEMQRKIIRAKCTQVSADLLRQVLSELRSRGAKGVRDSTRDMLTFAQYVQKLHDAGNTDPLKLARDQVFEKSSA